MNFRDLRDRYDVIVAGGRCAGAAAAMLLARAGLDVLVVDPSRRGSDTLSTHALMRGAVAQLRRWGLLERIRASGAPDVRTTTFVYACGPGAVEEIRIPIEPRDGIDALVAPRRTVLDPILQDGAVGAGADLLLGCAVRELLWSGGRVVGALLADGTGATRSVRAGLVVGADGVRSRVARLTGAEAVVTARHATATVYAYLEAPGVDGYHWGYLPRLGLGVIPTHDERACVFASVPPARFERERARGLARLHHGLLEEGRAALPDGLRTASPPARVRAFPGMPGFLRRSLGPGWALVGDAGYFRDPITAHGITDALRDAELLARAVATDRADALADWAAARDAAVRDFLAVTDRIASFSWDLQEIKSLHLELSRIMKRQARALDEPAAPIGATEPVASANAATTPSEAP